METLKAENAVMKASSMKPKKAGAEAVDLPDLPDPVAAVDLQVLTILL